MPKQHVSTSPRTPWSPNRTNVDFRVTTSKDLLAWHVWIHNDKSRFDGPHMLFIFCFEGSYLMLMCDLDWGLLQSACVGANQQSALFFSKKLRVQIWPGFFHIPHSLVRLSDGFKARLRYSDATARPPSPWWARQCAKVAGEYHGHILPLRWCLEVDVEVKEGLGWLGMAWGFCFPWQSWNL